MAKIATLSAPDKGELDRALKEQRKAVKEAEKKAKLEKLDNLLSRISSLSEYQSMIIEDRASVSYLSKDIKITSYSVFDLIWTITVWEGLCKNTNLYASAQEDLDPTYLRTVPS